MTGGLDIGLLDETNPASVSELQNVHWKRFMRVTMASLANSQIDLLLFPGTITEALTALTIGAPLVEVHTIVVFGGVGALKDPLASLRALRAEGGADVVCAASVPSEKVPAWLDTLLRTLARDRTLDEALFVAQADVDQDAIPLILANTEALREARTSAAASSLGARLSRIEATSGFESVHTSRIAGRLGLSEDASPQEIGSALETHAADIGWSHEPEAATELVELAETHDVALARLKRGGRFVQGRLMLVTDGGNSAIVREPLTAGQVYRLDIVVAVSRADWVAAPLALPEEQLRSSRKGHQLTVVLTAPGVLNEPEMSRLWLPIEGDSEACAFHFIAPQGVSALDARVTLLYRNRILQTLRLRAAIGSSPTAEGALTITLEAVVLAQVGALEGRGAFDAALILNDAGGEPGLSAFSGSNATYVKLRSVDTFARTLREELQKITRTPADYILTESEATRMLLVTLARIGSQFITSLRELPRMRKFLPDRGAKPRRIQVLSVHPDDLVPLEFAYDGTFPAEEATLCPDWRNGLEQGAASHVCPGSSQYVCPLAFWGLRHTIERPFYDPDDAERIEAAGAEVLLRSEAVDGRLPLGRVTHVLFGSATRAANFDESEFTASVTRIDAALKSRNVKFASVPNWTA